jgi:PAS domain S-box-containing protein
VGRRAGVSRWAALAVALDLAIAAGDALTTGPVRFTGAFVVAPLALAIVERARVVAAVAALSIALALASGVWNDFFGSLDHLARLLIVTVGSVLAVLAAGARRSAVRVSAELEATRERLDAILGAVAEAVTVQDESGKTIYANDAAVRLLGAASREEVLAARPGELAARFTITAEDGTPVAVEELPGRHAAAGEPAPPLLTRSVDRRTGRAYWLLTKASVVREPDGRVLAVNVIEDVTEAKEGELRLRFLAEAGSMLAASLDYQETLERVARLVVPELADWCAVDVVDERHGLRRVALGHVDPAKVDLGRELNERYPPDLDAPAGPGEVLRSGRSEVYAEITDEMLVAGAADEEHLRLMREIGLRSAMLVPMRLGERTTGVISLVASESGRTFGPGDVGFFEQLGILAATAVENARQYTERTKASETLQRSLLPERLPDVPGWRTAGWYQPGAPGVEVGGDFYDLFAVDEGFMVLLGDVTGKGVQAAALTSLARHTARTAALFDPRPAAVLRLLNRVLREQTSLSFVTVACARIEPSGLVTVASAGHPLPLRALADGGAMVVGAHGILLGASDDADWSEAPARLLPGDTLLFYTDGVTEAPGPAGRFGEERLTRLVSDAPRDPARLLAAVGDALNEFQTVAILDDRAMLAVQYTGAPGPVGEGLALSTASRI